MIEIITTKDGSHSLINHYLNETYHSAHGAHTESSHVFIKEGLKAYYDKNKTQDVFHVLEIGFGTGLNALLTWEFAQKYQIKVFYETLEPFPLSMDTVVKFNYADTIAIEGGVQAFEMMHQAPWAKKTVIDPSFTFFKQQMGLEEFTQARGFFDVVYFDAFAPKVQPELWEVSSLNNCYQALKQGGVFTTYCAQGQFKRDLKSLGFEVERVSGPPKGKREMTRAWK